MCVREGVVLLVLLCTQATEKLSSVQGPRRGRGLGSFDDIVVKIKELPSSEGKIINKVISVCKLILVNPATSASGERSFSTDRILKTCFRSTMRQE